MNHLNPTSAKILDELTGRQQIDLVRSRKELKETIKEIEADSIRLENYVVSWRELNRILGPSEESKAREVSLLAERDRLLKSASYLKGLLR